MNIYQKIKKKYDFDAPKWWECEWRRETCGKVSCPLCHRMLKREQKHKLDGKDPNDMAIVMEDVGDSLAESLMLLEQETKKRGIDLDQPVEIKEPPKPDQFPRYREVMRWHSIAHQLLENYPEMQVICLETEAGKDFLYYTNLLPAKVYRQLCNRWHLEQGDRDTALDYDYTQYIIRQATKILLKALYNLFYIKGLSAPAYQEILYLEEELYMMTEGLIEI